MNNGFEDIGISIDAGVNQINQNIDINIGNLADFLNGEFTRIVNAVEAIEDILNRNSVALVGAFKTIPVAP